MAKYWLLCLLLTMDHVALGQVPGNPSFSSADDSRDPPFREDSMSNIRPQLGLDLERVMGEGEAEHNGLLGRRLHGRGPVAFEYLYTGELLTNARGGITTKNATQYEGLLDLGMRLDFGTSQLPVPGKFFLLFQQTQGRGISTDFVGDAQIVSTIDSFNNITQVSQYWWELPFCEDFLTIRLGKQDINDEFHLTEIAADFVHSAYGIPPTMPGPTYPHQGMGAVLLAKLSDSLVAKAGIWDGYPDGMTWGLSGTDITFAIVELEKRYKLFRQLPGVIDVGCSGLSQVDIEPDQFMPQQYTIYVDFEQSLYREDLSDEENEQGLACFARYGTVFPKVSVPFTGYFSAGLVYKGLIRGRDEDWLGAAINHLQHNLGGTDTETATEVSYKAQINSWATVQPTFQFINSPSGIYSDSVVTGVRIQIML